MNRFGAFVLLTLIVLFYEAEVLCHRLNLYAILNDSTVEGEGTFGKGSPCKSCDVIILDAKGEEVSKDKTDQMGRFKIPLNKEHIKGPLKVILDAGSGHRAEWMIDVKGESKETIPLEKSQDLLGSQSTLVQEKAVGLSESELRTLIQQELQKALEPIKQELLGLHNPGIGFREIIGGLGYIFGIAGLALYLYDKKRYK